MAYDYGGYERQKGDINYKYTTDAANNAYGRFISQQRGQRNLGDKERSFKRNWAPYKASFGQRGLQGAGIGSGVAQKSMQNYMGDYGRDYLRTQQDLTQGLQQYDQNQSNLDAWRSNALVDLESDKANQIALAAQNLEALRQLLGGL